MCFKACNINLFSDLVLYYCWAPAFPVPGIIFLDVSGRCSAVCHAH